MKRTLQLLLILITVSLLTFVWVTPVFAISNPTSITMPTVKVFQNIFENNDVLFLLSYNVAYSTEPDEPASSTFLMSIYGTNGTTLIQSRPLNCYQYNIQSIYFNATQAAASLTWGSAYVVRVAGNPTYFATLTEGTNQVTTTLADANWIAGDMTNSRLLLKQHCLDLAANLENAWTVTLIVSTPDGDKLNSTGWTTFTEAIPGIDTAIPSLFQMTSTTIQIAEVPSTGAYAGTLSQIGTQLGTATQNAFNGIGTYLGVSGQMVAAMWIVLFMLIVASIVFLSSGSTSAAMVITIPIALIGVWVGAIPMAALFAIGTIIVAYMMYFIWLRGV
jgi:hypothetical protein